MVLDEGLQREWKRRLLVDALQRIAGIGEPPLEPMRSPGEALGYRTRIELTLAVSEQGAALGFHAAEGAEGVVDVERCLLQDDAANAVLTTLREALLAPDVAERKGRRVLIRRSRENGAIVVGLWESGAEFPDGRQLAQRLVAAHPDVQGVARIRARPGQRGGTRIEPLAGTTELDERIGGTLFQLPLTAFTQVNAAGGDEIVDQVVALCGDVSGARILDLYGGVGAYAFALRRAGAAELDVCDADAQALACGRKAKRRHRIGGIRFHHSDARRFLATHAAASGWKIVVANPPRTGLGRGVAESMVERKPQRVVLVSCDPATLARDVKALRRQGYGLRRVVPVDLFPQTAHVEAVALLEPV